MQSDHKLLDTKTYLTSSLSRLMRYLQSGWRSKLITLIFLGISFAIIGSVIASNWSSLKTYLWQIRPIWLIAGLLLAIADLLLGAYCWHLLVAHLTNYNQPRQNMKHWLYSGLAKRLPGPVWYIASRAVLYEQSGVSKVSISLLSGLEIAIVLVTGVITFLLTLPFWILPQDTWTEIGRSWPIFILLALCFVLVHPKVLTIIWQKASQQQPKSLKWKNTVVWCLHYMLVWIGGGITLYVIMNAFFPLPLSQIFSLIGMWAIANTISIAGTLALSGIGLREVSLLLLIAQITPTPVALLITIVNRLVWLTGELVGALLSLLL